MVAQRSELGVSSGPEMQMIRDIDLERLAGVVGESVARVGVGGGDTRIVGINCDSLDLSFIVAVIDKVAMLDRISFGGNRRAHSLTDGRVAVVWGKEGDSVTFVHRPRKADSGAVIVDVVEIVKGERFSDQTILLANALNEIKQAASFVEERTVALPSSIPQVDGSY
ncbi:hypothetical protein HYT17_03395 [Candidatus Microgenomates bacterium]|nr:hypothetical protein [Candidatus Microgenomates bacterium]